jgi:D-beta-D-heptose 7-phosphate kinase / D-beta-D-heptose 1-phosphate adenosyltransferase
MTLVELTDRAASLVADFRKKRVLVLGDAILDEYLTGDCSRISPEAPVPVLRVSNSRSVLGGAANTAANISSLGGHAQLIALVGNDEAGVTLSRCAQGAGVELHAIDHGSTTLRKTRVVGQHQQIVRLDYEEEQRSSRSIENEIFARFNACVDACDIVVLSDYAKGFVSLSLAQRLIQRAYQVRRSVIVDPRPQNRECYAGCDYVTPNWRESRALLHLPDAEPSPENVAGVACALAAKLKTNVVLTVGAHGIAFCSRNGRQQFALPTLAKEVFDVSGAGDTVVAAFALALTAGADHATAVAIANRAASVVVGKFGTATVTPEEILDDTEGRRPVPRQALAQLGSTLRAKGKRIVTTSGHFDMLHGGDFRMLNEMRQHGDVLIVGINGDPAEYHERSNRLIAPAHERAEMLLALRIVDYVHILDESDPNAFVNELKPDVHISWPQHVENSTENGMVREVTIS